MNIYLLSLIDKSIEGAMIRFSQLPVKSSLLSSNHIEKLAYLTKKILDSYIVFFKKAANTAALLTAGYVIYKIIVAAATWECGGCGALVTP
jgi:hypothetical protein